MLKIEVVKFEAQDVITASVVAPVEPVEPACTHSDTVPGSHVHPVHGYHEGDRYCANPDCGELVWCPFAE